MSEREVRIDVSDLSGLTDNERESLVNVRLREGGIDLARTWHSWRDLLERQVAFFQEGE